MTERSATPRRPRGAASDLLVAVSISVLVLGPLLLGRGFWLFGDMVFVPEQPWKPAWLGLDGALPRAVPMDALISVATQVVPGDIVQKALLAGGFVLGGLGVARFVRDVRRDVPWYARAAAITLFCWNPWVLERLLIGQWAILSGYFLLPWVALAGRRLGRDPRAWPLAAVTLPASAVCSPSSGVMAVLVLAVMALGRDRRVWWRLALIAVGANLTWAVPAVLATGVGVTTSGVFDVFAARSESAAGVLASVLGLGGIWKASIVPVERESAAVVLLACVLSLVAVVALVRARRGRLLLLGAIALVLALLPAVPGGAVLLEGLGERVPGAALLRDSHRFLAPLGLVLAVGLADAVVAVRSRIRSGTGSLWGAVALLVVAPLVLLPSLAWGNLGALERSSYPQEWHTVADLVGDDDVTVVLPWWGSYRGYGWNDTRAVLDPAPRFLPGTVIIDDRIQLRGDEVAAEDPRVVEVAAALDSDDPDLQAARLAGLGVRFVLVETGMGDPTVPSGAVRHDGDGLLLVELDAPDPDGSLTARASTMERVLIVTGHIAAVVLLLMGLAVILPYRSNEHHTA